MVNFSDSTTMTRPRKDIVNLMILQQLQDILEALEYFELKADKERENGLPELKSRIKAIIPLVSEPLSLRLKKHKLGKIQDLQDLRDSIDEIGYDDKDELYIIIDYISKFLYEKDVTKWDTKEAQDRTDILEMNKKILGGQG